MSGTIEKLNEQQGNVLTRSVWIALAVCFLLASCGMPSGRRTSVRQAWSPNRGPVIPYDTFPADCSICHAGGQWHQIHEDFRFDHALETGVPLFGAHCSAQCLRCHNDRGPVGIFAKRGCAGCHEDVHRGQLGGECCQCHNETNWVPGGLFALHNRTRFPLVGAHTGVACFRCHPGAQVGNFLRAPTRCEVCHQQDLKRAKNPDHIAQGWTQDCQQCHEPITWMISVFSHAGITNGCVACHLDNYLGTTSPNHAALGFPTTCEACHNTNAFK